MLFGRSTNHRLLKKPTMKKLFIVLSILLSTFYTLPPLAQAQCPVCTVAVIAGLGLSRWLGIDDLVSGVWVAGIILASSFWLANWLEKKFKLRSKFKYLNWAVIIPMYLLVFVPLQMMGITGHPFNTLLGIDKLILGTLVGSIVYPLGIWADKKVRKIKGKQLFNFQKVVFPVTLLLISSLILWIITKR